MPTEALKDARNKRTAAERCCIISDVRILRQKMQIMRILRKFSATFQPVFFYGKTVCDTGVISTLSWLVGRLKLRVTIQLTLSLRLMKMHCD